MAGASIEVASAWLTIGELELASSSIGSEAAWLSRGTISPELARHPERMIKSKPKSETIALRSLRIRTKIA